MRLDDATSQPEAPRRQLEVRTVTALVCGLAAIALFSLIGMAPVPYAIMKPGPVRDVLATGDEGEDPPIVIEGRETFETEGTLDLTTVSVFGGPGRDVSLVDVVLSWVDPDDAVLPEEQLFPPDQTQDEVENQNAEEMVSSQENATAAALGELDIPVPTTLTVVGFAEASDAEQQMRDGDVLTAVEGTPVPDLPQLRDRLQDVEAGGPVAITLERDGLPLDVEVTTLEGDDGQTLLGVLIDPTYDFPFDVAISIEDIGGPSAGMIFALGIVDKLTPGPLTAGEVVAGTGTIDSAGDVGPIGGIRQKLVGARDNGAEWFLAPAANCEEVVGHVPDGLTVVRVATLGDAHDAARAIGEGEAGDLPSCS